MFTFYKKHNNQLYNKLTQLSRNKLFYDKIKLSDNFETRILLIFFHLSIILKIAKKSDLKKKSQEIFDNIFQNIEYHIRELGYGDVAVNKNMKNFSKIFYDILYNIDQDSSEAEMTKNLLNKYFFTNTKLDQEKVVNLLEYFKKFRNFCFDLDINIMLNGSIDFNYR